MAEAIGCTITSVFMTLLTMYIDYNEASLFVHCVCSLFIASLWSITGYYWGRWLKKVREEESKNDL